jgi:N-ethylmaleimide reductase
VDIGMASASPAKLFTPVTLGAFALSHRVVMPAMNCGQATDAGVPTDAMTLHYGSRASAGGLIICEACAVSARTQGPGMAGLHTAEQVNQWQQVTRAVHARGGIVLAQLDHGSHWAGLPADAKTEIDDDALEAALIDYRNAAEHAGDAGFDGVELHAAHGALPERLMQDYLETPGLHRDDADRTHLDRSGTSRYAGEFLDAVTGTLANIWGADRVGVCLSPPTQDEEETDWIAAYVQLTRTLHANAFAFVHVADTCQPTDDLIGTWQRTSRLLRSACPTGLLVSGGFARSDAIAAVEGGAADAVAFGRAFIANPDLLDRLMHAS